MKILLVEDDLALSDVICFALRRAGFETIPIYDGAAAIDAFTTVQPALVVLDLNLPKQDGFTVCRHIRSQGATPVIILSVRSNDETIVQALELGADDYIVKPFSPAQLVARIRAVLRRAGTAPTPSLLECGGWTLDVTRHEVWWGGADAVRLTERRNYRRSGCGTRSRIASKRRRPGCRAGSSSAFAWRAHLPSNRRFSCATNPPRRSIRSRHAASKNCSTACAATTRW